ncbi:MAG TPA: right-handed parallel beta-helix repeat-containing protein, partial [Terriglobales bacterium]|nr:right-handed parallel beta-helix repeat-containing protein [Terriglobales bacterium]
MSPYLLIASNRKIFAILFECAVLILSCLWAVLGVAEAVDNASPSRSVTQKQNPGSPEADFFVAQNGNDSWSGTLPVPNKQNTDGPFASVARAQMAVRVLIQSNPNRPIIVMIRQGNYSLLLSPTNPGTLNFTTSDSGTSQMPILWENYPGEVPIVSGGEEISELGLTWTQVSGNLWQVQLPADTQPFESLFYRSTTGESAERRLRSRLQSAAGTGYYINDGSCYSTVTGQTVAIAECNLGTFLRIAATVPPGNTGCPSVSNGKESKCLDRFQYNPADPITTWSNLNGFYTGDPSQPCRADGSNPYPVGDVELTLFDSFTVDLMRINCVDTTNHIVYLTGPTQGLAVDYNCFGPTPGHRYVIDNAKDVFEQEQQDGQTGVWFVDRSSVPWTLSYIANDGENPNVNDVTIPQLLPATPTGGSIIVATQLSYVTFMGIVFQADNFIPPPSGFNNDQTGEGSFPAAIDCESCQYVTFDTITVRHTAATGLQIASIASHSGPPAANDVVQNSAFYDLGDSGIHIGHLPQGYDLATSVVHSVTVQNNVIQGYSRVFADGLGIAQGNGNNITYLHNDIDDGYHAGISVCGFGCPGQNGNNTVSQYNHLWNLMQGITSDGGALYYGIGNAQKTGSGNQILNNLVHDVSDASVIDRGLPGFGYGGQGIYLDFQSAGVSIENNVVYHVSASTVFIFEGPASGEPPNSLKNNIFAYGRK